VPAPAIRRGSAAGRQVHPCAPPKSGPSGIYVEVTLGTRRAATPLSSGKPFPPRNRPDADLPRSPLEVLRWILHRDVDDIREKQVPEPFSGSLD